MATEAPTAAPTPPDAPKEPGRISRTVTGVRERVEAGQQWVEQTGIPFFTTPHGRGAIPEDHPQLYPGVRSKAFRETDAIVRVVASLGGLWRMVHALRVLPPPLRDRLYRVVARNRYRWFGRHDACLLPPTGNEGRFLP